MRANLYSFDIVSRVELSELENALNQARKEVDTRFDFKGSLSRIEGGKESITIHSSDEFHLKAALDVLKTWLVRRKVPLNSIVWGPVEQGPKGTVKRTGKIVQGIDSDKSREIIKFIKKIDKKVGVAVQGDQLRVSSRSKDALQEVIRALKNADFGIALQFVNFRP